MSTAPSQHSNPLSPRHDGRTGIATVSWRREVPAAMCALGALANPNYADIFTAAIDQAPAEPEQLAHAALQGIPRGLLLLTPFVQRVFLGLRLKLRPAPDRLLGWKIAERGETDRGARWIRIEAASWFLTAHVVMHVNERQMSLASFIRYDRWPAALVWPPVSRVHRQVGFALLRSAIRAHSD